MIPEGVVEIGKWAFSYCPRLSKVTLPSTLTKIELFAFSNTAIEEVHVSGSVTEVAENAFPKDTKIIRE